MRVALDFEGVLADTALAARRESEILTEDHDRAWGFPTEEVYQEFMDVSQEICEERIEDVPAIEPFQAELVNVIRTVADVDLVTARYGCDEQIKDWLWCHDIEVDGFRNVEPGVSKIEFDDEYDVFIDDKPALAEKTDKVFLYDQPWNQNVEANVRIRSLADAANRLCFGGHRLVDPDVAMGD